MQRARASISIDMQSRKARTLLIESFKEAQLRVQRVWRAVIAKLEKKARVFLLSFPKALQSRVKRARASIYSDARAQKARVSLLEVPKAAQARAQRAMACMYSDAWKGVMQRLALPLARLKDAKSPPSV